MDEIGKSILELYDAVGDPDRWPRVDARFGAAARASAELEWHLTVARRAHERVVRLAADVEALASVHDQLALGALVVDRDGLVLRANDIGRSLLSQGDGLLLVEDRVRAAAAPDDARLLEAIARAASGVIQQRPPEEPFVLVSRSRRRSLSVLVCPATASPADFFDDRQPVTLLLIDPEATPAAGIDVLRALFGFTNREAEFAATLMRGMSVRDVARALGVTVATARTFLARAAAKTNSRSQAELVGRLLTVPRAAPPARRTSKGQR
jgi:DNA-binding CsgD family transcriptional regulator